MDGWIRTSLEQTTADEWLTSRGFGWLANEQLLQLVSIFATTIILYFLGRIAINWGLRKIIRSNAKQRGWHRKDTEKREKTLTQIIASIWRIIVFGYLLLTVMGRVFGINLAPIFASAGIIGVAIGFGSQSLVKDFLSGLFIIAENQYRVGDTVEIMGATGIVERVGARSTVIRDDEGNVHYIPNGTIQRVVNKTMGYSLPRFTIQVDASNDIDKIIKIINQTGKKLASETTWQKKIIDPPQFVSVDDISGKANNLTISGKTQPSDQWDVVSEMRRRLIDQFEKNNIQLSS